VSFRFAAGRAVLFPRDGPAFAGSASAPFRDATRWLLRWLGVEPHIARRGAPHGSGLGKVRWVVERTISWLKGLRRMRRRYDRLAVVQAAWNILAACVICYRLLREEVARAGKFWPGL
jgi:transposase